MLPNDLIIRFVTNKKYHANLNSSKTSVEIKVLKRTKRYITFEMNSVNGNITTAKKKLKTVKREQGKFIEFFNIKDFQVRLDVY